MFILLPDWHVNVQSAIHTPWVSFREYTPGSGYMHGTCGVDPRQGILGVKVMCMLQMITVVCFFNEQLLFPAKS